MKKSQITVHTENILPIIKKWLYSEKEIFLRELVSNACDALAKCKVLREKGESDIPDKELQIDIRIDKEQKRLTISDSGIGMTEEEVEKYIAQIAFSGAEEFLEKYRSQNEEDPIIGHFGLGFYSAYMVSKNVILETLSYKSSASPIRWQCNGGTEYEIGQGSRTSRGTDVILEIDADNEEFLEEETVRGLLRNYCAFLPFPILLNGKVLNEKDPLWLKQPSLCTEEEYLSFYRDLYPTDPDPIFWIHLNIDYPFTLKGILYFPKTKQPFERPGTKIKLFCNRVFVSDSCSDLIPDYLTGLKGAIDSTDIPLNVSRSYLQTDKTVRRLGSYISKKIADKLASTYQTEKETFTKIWPEIELIVKLGMLQDESFAEKAGSFLIWKNTRGEWTDIDAYLARNTDRTDNRIFYTAESKAIDPFLRLYHEKGIEVLLSSSPVDTMIMSSLERKKKDLRFLRIDGDIDKAVLDPSKDKTLLNAEGKTEATTLSELIASKLDRVKVEAKSLASSSLPGFIMVDEETRRWKEYLNLSGQPLPPKMLEEKTFVVNTNNKLVNSLPKIHADDPELAKDLVLQLYHLSLLSQKELDPSELSGFIERSERVLEKLATKE